MYSMWEVHNLVTEHHSSLVRDAAQASERRRLRVVPERQEHGQANGGSGKWLATLLLHWHLRRPVAARR